MKSYEVLFRPRARKNLVSLYRYIAKESSPEIAAGYVARIEKACLALATLPQRGTAIPSHLPGLRTMGFERRVTILFLVGEVQVEILRVYYGGQDMEPGLMRLLGS